MGCGLSRVHNDPDLLPIVAGARVAVVNTVDTTPAFALATVVRALPHPRSYTIHVDNRAITATFKAVRVREAADRSQDRSRGDLFVLLPERARRARPGTTIVVVWEADSALCDAKVHRRLRGARYELDVAGGERVRCELNAANHATQRFESVAEYDAARTAYLEGILQMNGVVEDAITGNKLRIEEQLIYIETMPAEEGASGLQHEVFDAAKSVKDLVPLLAAPAPMRHEGVFEATPLLVRAGPGTGKTWTMQQLNLLLAKHLNEQCCGNAHGVALVPFVIYVQRLARILRNPQPHPPGRSSSFVYMYILGEFGSSDAPEAKLLLMAYEMNSMVLLLDGVDEAAELLGPVERLIFEELIPRGIRFVVTSRPAGVDAHLADYRSRFVVMDLLPLSDAQQDAVIQEQLGENVFYKHLRAFSEIRTRHDVLYVRAFASAERMRLEELRVEDRFKAGGGEYDPSMRQRCLGGARVVGQIDGAPRSRYLRRLDGVLRAASALERLDAVVVGSVAIDESWGLDEKTDRKVVARLAKLLQKRARHETAAALWNSIVRRTDEIYLVAEHFEGVFAQVLLALEQELQDCDFSTGPLKDAVRIVEKAADDYSDRFGDGNLPEACVADVIRARIVCADASTVVHFVTRLADCGEWVLHLADGSTARLELIRAKNKFAVPDPTHFRNVLLNLRLWHGSKDAMFVEIQVHHAQILAHNDDSHAHEHYEYFRTRLCGSYDEGLDNDLDFFLERRMVAFAEICRVPVQLSMLCVVLQMHGGEHGESASAARLPSTQRELYDAAVESVLERHFAATGERAVAWRMLSRLAVANHRARRREFASVDAEHALAEDTEALGLWLRLLKSGEGVLLIKTIVMSEGDDGVFQFKHLSLQEALFVRTLIDDEAALQRELWPASKDALVERLNEVFLQNAFRIGGAELAARLPPCGEELVVGEGLSGVGQVSLALLLPGLGCTRLRLECVVIEKEGAEAICAALAGSSVRELVVKGCSIGVESGAAFVSVLVGGVAWKLQLGARKQLPLRKLCEDTIVHLDLSDGGIGDAGAGVLAGALRRNHSLRSLNVSGNAITAEGYGVLRAVVESNDALCGVLELVDDYLSWIRTCVNPLPNGTLKKVLKDSDQEEVGLGKKRLGDAEAALVATYIGFNPKLREIRLHSNQIGPVGAKAIGTVLRQNTTLHRLFLSDNHIGSDGAMAIGATLCENTTPLVELWLSENQIGDEGAKAIGAALRENTTLRKLVFSRNPIGNEGAVSVGAALRENTTLWELVLQNNKIGDEGAKAIAAALRENSTLVRFYSEGNMYGSEGQSALQEAFDYAKDGKRGGGGGVALRIRV